MPWAATVRVIIVLWPFRQSMHDESGYVLIGLV